MFLSISKVNAQDTIQYKKNEIWANFFNPGVTYKRGLNSKTFLTAGITLGITKGKSRQDYSNSGVNNNTIQDNKYDNSMQNISFDLGIEKRSTLSSKMTLFHGPEISFGLSSNKSKNSNKDRDEDDGTYQESKQNSQSFGIGYTIGAIYSFNSYLGIGVGWSPSVYYSFSKRESTYHNNNSQTTQISNTKDNNFGVQLSTPSVSLVLKF